MVTIEWPQQHPAVFHNHLVYILVASMSVPQYLLGCVVSFALLLLQLAPSRAWTVATPTSFSAAGVTARRRHQLAPLRDNVLMPDGGVSPCVIRVLGVGGGGCNAVERMLDKTVDGIEYWCINSDHQALSRSQAKGAKTLSIGATVTRGLGAGGDPAKGQLAAEENMAELGELVEGADLIFVTAGMGGGTGSGAAPVVARMAQSAGALTIGIVTKPFGFEGRRRKQQAEEGIARLRQAVDTNIVVSNNKLLEILPDDTPVTSAFEFADDILRKAVAGIAEIIVRPGVVNVDFADVKAVMQGAGRAIIGIGTGTGKRRATDAAEAAMNSPLLDEPVQQATGVVFNIAGPPDLTLNEVNQAAQVIYDRIHEDCNVIFGALLDESVSGDEVSITVLATGGDDGSP